MARPNAFNPTHIPTDEVLEKERQVLELRRAGVSFDKIATDVGYADRGAAHKAYKRSLARTLQQPAAEVRELEADRLDRLQVAVWAQALRGSLPAVDRALSIMTRRAKLLGLDHADGIAERALQLEAFKVRHMAMAVGKVFDELQLSEADRERGTRVLLTELRALEAADGEDPGGAEVVAGEVAP